MRRVAGYFRVSKARDGMSAPEIYAKEIERYCDYKGLALGRIFSDIDHSGWHRSRARPALLEMVAERANFSAVIVPKLSRFGRDLGHLTELFDLFDREGIALVFLDLGIDTRTSGGKLLRNVMASIAEYESDIKSDFSKASHRHIASQGRPWGGTAPFGYVYDRTAKNYVVLPAEAAVVREVFERFVGAETMNSILRDLTARDVKTKKGLPWTVETLRRLLANPAHTGLRPFGGELIEATWEAIVPRALWQKAGDRREMLRRKSRGPTSADRHSQYLMTGIMVCGTCGRGLVHRPEPNARNGMHVCPKSGHFAGPCPGGGIGTHRAEEMVVRAFKNRFWFTFQDDRRIKDLERRWESASTVERRDMLKLAIARVELVPRPVDNRLGKGLARGRQIKIVWADGWKDLSVSQAPEVVPVRSGDAKYCRGCGLVKLPSEFESDASRWDAKSSRCKGCRNKTRKKASSREKALSHQARWRLFREGLEREHGPAVSPPHKEQTR